NNENVDFFNNIVFDNSSNGGAIAVGEGGTINIKNSIIYGNGNYQFQTHRGNEPSYVNIEHSLIQGGTNPSVLHIAGTEPYGVEFNWGEGIIASPPDFIGGEDEYDPLYYQLSEFSSCIDAGTPDTTGLFLPPWDLLYNYRVWDGNDDGTAIIDIGCYEYGADEYTGIDEPEIIVPTEIEMSNYPNPFNSSTTISFELSTKNAKNTKIEIYNVKGQKVKTLLNEHLANGKHSVIWFGLNDDNIPVNSGIYFYKIKVGNIKTVKRMLFLK
ncbi:MAG: hypothetical protein DRZ79_05875, partial [Candidatus Cloacimonadota bacterium]